MNVSTPPKHRWQPQEYEHVVSSDQSRDEWYRSFERLVSFGLSWENQMMRNKLSLFDDSHAHMIDTIEVSYDKPPRTSIKLDGLEIAHLLAFDPEPKPIPADCDYPINRLSCTFNAKKLIVKGDYDD